MCRAEAPTIGVSSWPRPYGARRMTPEMATMDSRGPAAASRRSIRENSSVEYVPVRPVNGPGT